MTKYDDLSPDYVFNGSDDGDHEVESFSETRESSDSSSTVRPPFTVNPLVGESIVISTPVIGSKGTQSGSNDVMNERAPSSGLNKGKMIFVALLCFALAVGAAFFVNYVVSPVLDTRDANRNLESLQESRGEVTMMDHRVADFTGEKYLDLEETQKQLSYTENNFTQGQVVHDDNAVFVFNNGNPVEDRRVVDIYLDFSSPASRDFVIINYPMLTALMENGEIEVRVHPVPGDSPLSMYAPETLAELSVSHPDDTWRVLPDLLGLAANLEDMSPKGTAEAIIEIVDNKLITEIGTGEVSDGTFSDWIIAVGEDERLTTGYYPPVVYVNGTELTGGDFNPNDNEALRQSILDE